MIDERKRRLLFNLAITRPEDSLYAFPSWGDHCWLCKEPIVPMTPENVKLHMDLHLVQLGSEAQAFESFLAMRTDALGKVDIRSAVRDFFGYDPVSWQESRAFWTKRRLGQP